MTKVYLLMRGEYSDTTVEAVFSQKDEAERIASLDESDDFRIEEFELDEWKDWTYSTSYCAVAGIKTGEVINTSHHIHLHHPTRCEVRLFKNRDQILVQSPISPEHAAKVAAEKRQEFLRCQAIGTLPEWA